MFQVGKAYQVSNDRASDRPLGGGWTDLVRCDRMISMEKAVRIFDSFAESDEADKAYYHSLSPKERLDILLELNRRCWDEADAETGPRLARVYRIIELSPG